MRQIDDIESAYENALVTDPRDAAELAYVIAMQSMNSGDTGKAEAYAQKCLELFERLDPQTIEECAARNVVVNGIALPDLIHADLVRERFEKLL
ncbi:MAG: hypothetical protein HGB08_03610 [Candidatus Moranbacteria bacterium]|nr:hypothetical protein [Candidatus Moranbacteria bacterium]